MGRVLVIGFSEGLLSHLVGVVPEGSVAVVEEPEVFRQRNLAAKLADLPCVGELLEAAYQQSDEVLERAMRAHHEAPFEAIVPSMEYAVPAAAALAHELGLPGATIAAATALRDKLRLREVTSRAGILNPEWREIWGPSDIRSFADGGPVVVKPANRRGSAGVQLLDDPRDADVAWSNMVSVSEGPRLASRPMRWRHMVERRLVGGEYSVEALVRRGHILFENVTQKLVAPGRYPVEIGHAVPAPLDPGDRKRFSSAMRLLVSSTGFADGMLHAEWILTERGPALVECAGRPPGDKIVDLIDLAYGSRLYVALLDLLAGRAVDVAAFPERAAAIRFLVASPGVVRSVRGVAEASTQSGVEEISLTVSRDSRIRPLRSSWDRCGHVVATGTTSRTAAARAAAGAGCIRIETQD